MIGIYCGTVKEVSSSKSSIIGLIFNKYDKTVVKDHLIRLMTTSDR